MDRLRQPRQRHRVSVAEPPMRRVPRPEGPGEHDQSNNTPSLRSSARLAAAMTGVTRYVDRTIRLPPDLFPRRSLIPWRGGDRGGFLVVVLD